MKAAVFSDVHGNLIALDAVLAAAREREVDEFWIVGDLVAHGPQPAATIGRLMELDGARIVRGNTDRYVLTGDLPAIPSLRSPSTPEDHRALHETISAHAYTRGCITTAGGYEWLAALPIEHRDTLPDGTRTLLVHASPGHDDGRGIREAMTDDELAADGWTAAGADLIFVGHTHRPLDRTVGSTRVINLGSVSVPLTDEQGAMWTLLEATNAGWEIERCVEPYDVDAVLTAMDEAHHPSRDWLRSKYRSDSP